MDAVEFLKEKNRMTNDCCISCYDCPLYEKNNKKKTDCSDLEDKYPETAVEIVEQWSREHPRKTRQSEFLKLFPDAKIVNGHINICPQDADSKLSGLMSCVDSCAKCKDQYWLAEVE